MSEAVTIPMWLLVALIAGRYMIDAKSWWRNGKNGNVCRVEQMLREDSPRKHTDLLKDIHAELKMMRKDLRYLGDKSGGG